MAITVMGITVNKILKTKTYCQHKQDSNRTGSCTLWPTHAKH